TRLAGQGRVALGAGQEGGDVAIGTVLEMALQPRHRAVDADGLVYAALDEAAPAARAQPDLPVGIGAAVAHPATPEDVAAGHGVARVLVVLALHDGRDLRMQLG